MPGSYWAFGNTGTHTLDAALSTGSVTALQGLLPGCTTQQPTGVIDALMASSDHLPIVADYQLPARLAVTAPTRQATLTVATASPQAAAGPFTRSYTVSVLDPAVMAKTGSEGSVAGPTRGWGSPRACPGAARRRCWPARRATPPR